MYIYIYSIPAKDIIMLFEKAKRQTKHPDEPSRFTSLLITAPKLVPPQYIDIISARSIISLQWF